jgi:hypothetical protein
VAGVDGEIRAMLRLTDGGVLLGGIFRAAGDTASQNLVEYDPDSGTFRGFGDFFSGIGIGEVDSLLELSDGSVLVGGYFPQPQFSPTRCLYHYFPSTGEIVPVEGFEVGGTYAMAELPDGRVVLGGGFDFLGSFDWVSVALYDPESNTVSHLGDGGVSGLRGTVRALAVLPDGRLIAGTEIGSPQEGVAGAIYVFDAQSQTWGLFADGLFKSSYIFSGLSVKHLLVLDNGDLMVGGEFGQAGDAPAGNLARYEVATSSWIPMGEEFNGWPVSVLERLSGGRVLVGNSDGPYSPYPVPLISLDPRTGEMNALSDDVIVNPTAAVELPSGDILTVAEPFDRTVLPARNLVRLRGSDHTWQPERQGEAGWIESMAPLPNGDVLGVWRQDLAFSYPHGAVRIYRSQTGQWTIVPGLEDRSLGQIVRLPNGDLVGVGGLGNGSGGSSLVRFSAATETLSIAGPALSEYNRGMWALGDDSLISLELGYVGDQRSFQVRRFRFGESQWTNAGTPLTGYDPDAFAVTTDNRVILAGSNLVSNGQSLSPLAVLDVATSTWSALDAHLGSSTDYITGVSPLPGGDIIAYGSFGVINGVDAQGIARLDHQAGTWHAVPIESNPFLSRIWLTNASRTEGDLLGIASLYEPESQQFENHVVRYRAASDSITVEANIGPDDRERVVTSIQEVEGGFVVGGKFSVIDGVVSTSFARWTTLCHDPCNPDLNGDGVPDQGDVDVLINAIAGGGTPPGLNTDFNHDGAGDQGDVDALVSAIAGGECP